jgi:hypothetical protein
MKQFMARNTGSCMIFMITAAIGFVIAVPLYVA